MTALRDFSAIADGVRRTVSQLKGQGRVAEAEDLIKEASAKFQVNADHFRAEANKPVPNTTATTAENAHTLHGELLRQREDALPIAQKELDLVQGGQERAGRMRTDATRRLLQHSTEAFDANTGIANQAHKYRTRVNVDAESEARQRHIDAITPLIDRSFRSGAEGRAVVRDLGGQALGNQDRMQQRYVDAAVALARDTPLDWLGTLGGLAASIGALFTV